MDQDLKQTSSPAEVRRLWELCQQKGISRRWFMQLFAIGGSAAVLSACGMVAEAVQVTPTVEVPGTEEPPPPGWAKDPTPFIVRGTNLETRLENLSGWLTPIPLFFVRNNSPSSPRIDVTSYRLVVEGDAIDTPLELTYEDLRRMPSRSVAAYLECAGNQRNLFAEIMGQQAEGGEWLTGGVSQATWTGVPLAHVLELAGIRDTAAYVNLKGLDTAAPEGGFQRPMTAEKAMDPDTLLAYTMNGEDLPVDHGFPVRGLVPGWVGSSSIKWVGSITVSSEPIWVRNNTTSYVLIGPEWPPEQYAPAQGGPITTQTIKSALALPWPAALSAGPQIIRGFAFSPHAPIALVEWSADGGQTWQEARLVSPNLLYSWIRFEFDWDAQPGTEGLMTRATDEAGNTQPDEIPFNQDGYLFNRVYQHPVTVT